MTEERFRVDVKMNDRSWWTNSDRQRKPDYFDNFWKHCDKIARKNRWLTITVVNYELRPFGGKLIQTKTQGWYLRWDTEAAHTMFVLKWS